MLSTHQFVLLYFFKGNCFLFQLSFLIYIFRLDCSSDYIFSIKLRILNTSIDCPYSNIFSSSFPHLLQVMFFFLKIHDILGFLNFLCLPQITQYNFFIFLVIKIFLVYFIILLIFIRRK